MSCLYPLYLRRTRPIETLAAVHSFRTSSAAGYTTQFIFFSGRPGIGSAGTLKLFSQRGDVLDWELAARGRSPFLTVAAVYDRRISLISGPSAVIDRRYSSDSHTSATGGWGIPTALQSLLKQPDARNAGGAGVKNLW